MEKYIVSSVVLVLLGIEGAMDLRTRKINILLASVFIVMGIIYGIVGKNYLDIFISIIPGIVMMVIAQIHKNIGIGDGIVVMASGVWIGFEKILLLVWISMILAGVTGSIFCMINKKSRDYKIPYIPFVFAGYMLMVIVKI